jgi:hypothetical protein
MITVELAKEKCICQYCLQRVMVYDDHINNEKTYAHRLCIPINDGPIAVIENLEQLTQFLSNTQDNLPILLFDQKKNEHRTPIFEICVDGKGNKWMQIR